MKKSGFSLVELMVVIAIIGILAFAATPTYLNYLVKSRVAAQIPVLVAAADSYKLKYDAGIIPDEEEVIETSNGPTLVYYPQGSLPGYGVTVDEDVFIVCVHVPGLESMPDDPVNGAYFPYPEGPESQGRRDQVCMKLEYNEDTDLFDNYCGSWDISGNGALHMVPLEYLPAYCHCSSIGDEVCS